MNSATFSFQSFESTAWNPRIEDCRTSDYFKPEWKSLTMQDFSTTSGANTPRSGTETPNSGAETPITERSCYEEPSTLEIVDVSDEYIMVTGGLGYIGSHTTLELLIAGYNVVVIDNLNNSHDKVLNTITQLARERCNATNTKLPKLVFHEMDYRGSAMRDILSSYAVHSSPEDESAVLQSKVTSKIAGVIHFAAYKSVEESISSPLRYYQNNVCGLVDFLDVLDEFNIHHFVFSSSATVYGDKALRGVPLHEEDLVHHPLQHTNQDGSTELRLPGTTGITSPYGRTKSFAESILADIAYADPTWKITALRYFNPVGCHPSGLLGEDPRQKPTNLFPVIGRVLTGESNELNIFGNDWATPDGTAIRDFIHILDLAGGHVAAMAASCRGTINEPFRAYNLGTGNGASVQEVITAVQEAVGSHIPVAHCPRRAGDVGYCVAATTRVEKELGWKAMIPLIDGARDMWNFLCKTKMEGNAL